MNDSSQRLITSINDVLKSLANRDDGTAIGQLLFLLGDRLEEWCEEQPAAISMLGIEGAPDWYVHETRTWRVASQVRQAVRESVGTKGLVAASEALESFVDKSSLGKGRQAWAVLALEVGGEPTAKRLAKHLGDEELDGIVLKGLNKHRVPGYAGQAATIAAAGRTGVARSQAKRYLKLAL